MDTPQRPLHWVGTSLNDLRDCPEDVKDEIGYGLHLAQEGDKHPNAKPLRGFGGAGVLEIIDNYEGDTYRAVYTVRFALAVYVLHVFQKKSKQGIATPPKDVALIRQRLLKAEEHYEQLYGKGKP